MTAFHRVWSFPSPFICLRLVYVFLYVYGVLDDAHAYIFLAASLHLVLHEPCSTVSIILILLPAVPDVCCQALLGAGTKETRAASAFLKERDVSIQRGGTASAGIVERGGGSPPMDGEWHAAGGGAAADSGGGGTGSRSDGIPPLPTAPTSPSGGKLGAGKDQFPVPHSNKISKDNHKEFNDWKKRTDNLAAAVLAAARVSRGPSSPPAPPVSLCLFGVFPYVL